MLKLVKYFLCTITLVGQIITPVSAYADTVNGAGATFPFPIYSKWSHDFYQLTGNQINYQSIGSGAGIAQIKAKTVDFGASDAPLSKADLQTNQLVQFPMIIGGVVPAYFLPQIKGKTLKLDGETLAQIFLGQILRWNDAKIARLNPDLVLPDIAITVVHRSDGSGTTWVFTNYLSQVSESWKSTVGFANAVKWPAGIAGKGNEGVSGYVQKIQGAIGYLEFAYAYQNKIDMAQMQNLDGLFVTPSIDSFFAAAANASWQRESGFYQVLTNQKGAQSWPITGASFILLQKSSLDAKRTKTALNFFDWAYTNGKDSARALHYVPLPENVVNLVKEEWKNIATNGSEPLWP